ncbi:MAG: FAD synthase [Parcubacteria group bacterium GW2011_GWA2_51_12]|nr:MAG: FAD synthase [Parcubacteria group bacterium GW2011_GWA2_51_12]
MKKVLVFGTFDVIHPGHISFLKQAKKYGDFLIVSLAREKYIRKIKGQSARHSETERKALLESLRLVNKVVFGSKTDYVGHILSIKPSVIVLGYDQKAFTEKLGEKLAERGLKVRIVRAGAYKPAIYKSSKLKWN